MHAPTQINWEEKYNSTVRKFRELEDRHRVICGRVESEVEIHKKAAESLARENVEIRDINKRNSEAYKQKKTEYEVEINSLRRLCEDIRRGHYEYKQDTKIKIAELLEKINELKVEVNRLSRYEPKERWYHHIFRWLKSRL